MFFQLKNFLKGFLSSFLLICGIGLIFISFFADKLGLGKSGSLGMGPFEKLCLLIGVVAVLVWIIFRKHSFVIGVNLVIFFLSFLFLDPILYYLSPWFSPTLIARMSPAAQERYANFHKGYERYVHYDKKPGVDPSDYCYEDKKGRPYYSGYEFTYTFQYDEFGYRNPPGYISKNDADVLVLGDSFTEGIESAVTIAEYLRTYLKPLIVYSTGICNGELWNYLCQYRHYIQLKGSHKKPKYVLVNLYGNDFYLKDSVEKNLKSRKPQSSQKESFMNSKSELVQKQENRVVSAAENQDQNKFFLNPQEHTSRLPFKNEPFIIAEHFFEEAIVKVIMNPKRYALWNKFLRSIGMNQSQWQKGMKLYNTPNFDVIDWEYFAHELNNLRDEVVETDPQASIVVSFIPNSAETCDIRIREEDASRCQTALANQQKISNKVKDLVENLNLTYIDITPQLREYAAGYNQSLYMWNGHFNLYGYDVYSQFCAKKLLEKIGK